MLRKSKKEVSALQIALDEIKKVKRMNTLEKIFFIIAVFSVLILLFLLINEIVMTGYTYIDSQAGSISSLTIRATLPTTYWHGIHGLALRVPGYFSQIYTDVTPGEISSMGVFFDCLQNDAVGGREIYISEGSSINWGGLVPATTNQVDSYLNCSGEVYCANNTFMDKMEVMLGPQNITNIPATYTYKFDGNNSVFDLGILWDGSNLVYVTHVTNLQQGYSNISTVNFQALLPTTPGSDHRFYFFSDPYDVCPEGGGLGETLLISLSGYINDLDGNPVENASVIFTGFNDSSNVNGYYNISSTVVPGTYTGLVVAEGYDDYTFSLEIGYSNNTLTRNITLSPETPGLGDTVNPNVYGYVKGSNGFLLNEAVVLLGNSNFSTGADGFYNISPTLFKGISPIVSYRQGYDNYYEVMNFSNSSSIYKNITLQQVVDSYPYATGPYTEDFDSNDDGRYDERLEAVESGQDYWISTKFIKKEIRQETFIKDSISIFNFKDSNLNVAFTLSESLLGVVELDNNILSILPNSEGSIQLTFYGNRPLGFYNGSISVEGDINQIIPVEVDIIEKRRTIETLLIDIVLFDSFVAPGETLKYEITLTNLLRGQGYDVFLENYLEDIQGNWKIDLGDEFIDIRDTHTSLKEIQIPSNISEGDYQLRVNAQYLNFLTTIVAPVKIQNPLYLYSFLGIPLWVFLLVISTFSFIFLVFFVYKREKEKRQRYRNSLDVASLPKYGERALILGKIAESKLPAYYPLDNLSTHAIVAGATGGGKSISAQVIVEEALLKKTAVIVFDPTAQWSGLLRKCDDKRMLSYYPKFNLKPSDAKAFPGNIRMISDARELVDVKKYAMPGQIQIFTMNKLQPKDIDIFVANVIRGIFESDPKEKPQLEILIVFDEVHRLLAKFGGTGEGFLQIERACREFRKWGMGVMLVSQVLSDFMGEIKANINTEVQMRTIEEGDLSRIRTKYGDEFLKSLVKSEVGVGMIQNAEFNKGKPYFVNFRPILHNTRRLTDEELEKYNNYNTQVDQIEFEIETIEKKKIDVFDLKMELKLVKDKIMVGNFAVVDIYLQGLKPRLEKQWEKLGEKAPKLVKKLANLEDIKKSVEEAKKERAKAEEAVKSKAKETKEEDKSENKEKTKETVKKDGNDKTEENKK